MTAASTPAGYLHEDVVLMLSDVETTGLYPETDHVIELAAVFVRWPSLEVLAEQEWLVQAPDVCFEPDPPPPPREGFESGHLGVRWKSSHRGASRVHQISPALVFSDALWVAHCAGDRANGPIAPAEVAIELCDLVAQVKRGSRARKIVLTSDNVVFEHKFIEKLLKAAGERWPFHYCSWDTSLLLDGTGVGDPTDPPHRAMADTQALLGQMRAAMEHIRWAQGFAPEAGPSTALAEEDAPGALPGGARYAMIMCSGGCDRSESTGADEPDRVFKRGGWEHFPLRGWVCPDCKAAVRAHEDQESGL